MNKIAVVLISGYQKYISQRKGFACAYRVLYNGESCSEYIKRMFIEQDLSRAIKAANHRFKACKKANQIIKLQAISNSEKSEKSGKNQPRKVKTKKVKDASQKRLNCNRTIQNIDCCYLEMLECSDCTFPELDCGSCRLDSTPDCGSCCG
ncbi:MAG: membrane protein insertion efficiency factor YidD [Microcoleaceae cyanobacterium MO_207.B10]|nr:membrane protein insertion efficiency factor YidD [Microcoleaceae cyanobacterium MO_207.B10]